MTTAGQTMRHARLERLRDDCNALSRAVGLKKGKTVIDRLEVPTVEPMSRRP